MTSSVAIVGSLHMETWIRTPRVARAGERIVGAEFREHPGGKGATQAVQASRLDAKVTLIGALGDDARGAEIKTLLASEAVDLEGVLQLEEQPTGAAFVQLAPEKAPAVTIARGANGAVTAEEVDRAASQIAAAKVLVLHCELEEETNLKALSHAERSQAIVVLNATPAERASTELLRGVRTLVVSEGEGRKLLGKAADDCSVSGLARRLASKGPEEVVVLRGEEGALLFDGEEVVSFAPPGKQTLVDPLGVEDAFVGAFAVRMAETGRLREAVQWGVAAAALAGAKEGAMTSLPDRAAVEALLDRAASA